MIRNAWAPIIFTAVMGLPWLNTAEGVEWRRIVLNKDSVFEAAGVADFNGDGLLDIMCGDTWYAGPSWTPHRIGEIDAYGTYRADFANVPMDVNGDGLMDVVSCNWHKRSVVWRENPVDTNSPWPEHLVDTPGNMETAISVDVDMDGRIDFLPDVSDKTVWYRLEQGTLKRYVISPNIGGHGIGFGDVNGDGLKDVLKPDGWFEAPQDPLAEVWTWHQEWQLGPAGIDIIAHDFNRDGLTDVLWGMGHDYGLFWLEQVTVTNGSRKWVRHEIDRSWSQAHALRLVDLDGDGRMEEVLTGKRRYAHEGGDPGAEDPQIVCYYQYDLPSNSFARHIIRTGDDGMGLAPAVADVDGDGDLDFVAPGKTGLALYLQENKARPKDPDTARSGIHMPKGFEVTLFASEPRIRKPIAMAFDERGRMVIAEAAMYPLGPAPGEKAADTVKILEDTDGDGQADVIKVFADGLNIPCAVAVGHGGIYVAEAPNLWFMRDLDGDDRADERTAILTNFGREDTHHLVHGLVWGPAGRLMMTQGCMVRSKITADGKPWLLKHGDFFRCWPDGTGFEIVFKGFTNSWGFDWDDYGNWIANDNEGPHLIHLVEGADYGFSLPDRHDGEPGTLPAMTRRYGQQRGYLVQSGMTIYSGDAFPAHYQGSVFQGCLNRHSVICDSLQRQGATFIADLNDNLMTSQDKWHLPIAMTVGPDGAVYVIDWYNEIYQHVEHPLDSPRRDKTRGRIYRIAWGSAPKTTVPDLRQATPQQLAGNLRSNNRWIRRTSQRLLAARGPAVLDLILPMLNGSESPRTRCHVLWSLEEMRLVETGDHNSRIALALRSALEDPDPWVRANALRFVRRIRIAHPTIQKPLMSLAQDPDDLVKFEMLRTITALHDRLPYEDISPLIGQNDPQDAFLNWAFREFVLAFQAEILARALSPNATDLAQVSRSHLRALSQIRDLRVESPLIRSLDQPGLDADALEVIVEGLYALRTPATFRALLEVLASRRGLPPHLVRQILADMRQGSVAETMDKTLISTTFKHLATDPESELLADVFLTAAHLGNHALAPQLVEAFTSSDDAVAEAAILSAGQLRLSDAADSLIKLLPAAQGRRRWALVRALTQIAHVSKANEAFLSSLDDPDSSRDCLAGLRRLSAEPGGEHLLDDVLDFISANHVGLSHLASRQLQAWIEHDNAMTGRTSRQPALIEGGGILRDWLVAGPFPSPNGQGHTTVYPPEERLNTEDEFTTYYRQIKWTPFHTADTNGVVDLTILRPKEFVVAYAWARVHREEATAAVFYAGSDDSIKAWVNGELVIDHLINRSIGIDQEHAIIMLKPGRNDILLKIGQSLGGWLFHGRLRPAPPRLTQRPDDLHTKALYLRGDPQRGRGIFFGAPGCIRCHTLDGQGGRVGPDLTRIARYNPKSHIIRSILEPSADLADGFHGVTIETGEGEVLEGYIHRETPKEMIFVTSEGKTKTIPKSLIANRVVHETSGMPTGLEQTMTEQEFIDLVALLEEHE